MVMCCGVAGVMACGGNHSNEISKDFTKIDSLTETYLTLQDTMLKAWNVMANDENKKIKAMRKLVSELEPQSPDTERIKSLEKRLDELEKIRFTQKTISEPHVVEEYDFASNSLISELITMSEADPRFATSHELQNLVDWIRVADQRVSTYRSEYDAATEGFNHFLDVNKAYLKEIDQSNNVQKRPLFQMASDN